MRHLVYLLVLISANAVTAQLPFGLIDVKITTVDEFAVFDGHIEAEQQSTVSAKLAGEIAAIYFDVDDLVEKNAVIIEFKNRGEKAELRAATAKLQEAQAQRQDAEQEFQRTEEVFQKKLVSKAKFDRDKAALHAARARLKAARAKRDAADERYEHTTVRAPYAGIVAQRHVEVGESTTPGQPLMTGYSLDKLRAVANIPQRLVNVIRPLKNADIITTDNQFSSSELTFIPHTRTGSHSYETRVRLPAGASGVFPGQFVKVRFATGQRQTIRIPRQAVVYRSEVTGVYVIGDADKVIFRHIRTGRLWKDQVEVLSGLAAGEKIANDPIKAGIFLKDQRKAH